MRRVPEALADGLVVRTGVGVDRFGLDRGVAWLFTPPVPQTVGLLAGNGTINAAFVTAESGVLAPGMRESTVIQAFGSETPGDTVGTLTVNGTLRMDAGSEFRVEVSGSPPGNRRIPSVYSHRGDGAEAGLRALPPWTRRSATGRRIR